MDTTLNFTLIFRGLARIFYPVTENQTKKNNPKHFNAECSGVWLNN
jgi:hypothetical protein